MRWGALPNARKPWCHIDFVFIVFRGLQCLIFYVANAA